MAGEAVERDHPPVDRDVDPLLGRQGRYVVGIDGGAASGAALAWAASRALPGRPVHVVGIVTELGAGAEARSARALAEAAERLRVAYPGARITSATGRGTVATALVEAAEGGDLLVIGSDKTGYVSGRVFGLRSIELAAAARGPIAVIPSVDLRYRTGVAVAVGDLASAASLARRGALEAARAGWSLAIVHAASPDDDRSRAQAAEVVAAAQRAALEVDAHLDVRARVVRRRPAAAILDVARDRALLLVGRSRAASVLGVGQTLHDVLMNVNAPTVIVE